jgi:hypothetical protein
VIKSEVLLLAHGPHGISKCDMNVKPQLDNYIKKYRIFLMQTHYKNQIREIKLQGILNTWNVRFRIQLKLQKIWIHSLRIKNFKTNSVNYPP